MYNEFIKLQKEMITLKVFIWLCCFFVVAVIQTAAREAGIILGAIPAMLLFGLAWWSAKKFCALWDQRQAEKAALAASASPDPIPLPTEPEPTITDSTAPATPKLRYCKHCGSPLDPATHQCTGCGKQYFRPPVLRKKYLAIAAGVLVCAAIMFLVVNLVSQKNAAEAKVEELTVRVAELERAVAEKAEQIKSGDLTIGDYMIEIAKKDTVISEIKEEIATYREYLDYCEIYCAYITCSDGKISSSIYHRLDCPYTETADYLRILYIDFLEENGFKPCPHCYG